MIRGAITTLLLTLANPLAAEIVAPLSDEDFIDPRFDHFEPGLVCNPLVLEQVEAPDTVSGSVNILEEIPEMSVDSRRVPAVIGISFGALVAASGAATGPMIMSVTHPPMGPQEMTVQSYYYGQVGASAAPILYSLENEAELVTGQWTFEARESGKLVLRFSFEVVAPEQVPELARLCGFEHLLS